MDNDQFKAYLEQRMKAVREEQGREGLTVRRYIELRDQLALLEDGHRIMVYGTGPARRRFRRNYERSLLRQGKRLEDLR